VLLEQSIRSQVRLVARSRGLTRPRFDVCKTQFLDQVVDLILTTRDESERDDLAVCNSTSVDLMHVEFSRSGLHKNRRAPVRGESIPGVEERPTGLEAFGGI